MSGTGWAGEAPCAGDTRFTPNDASEESLRALGFQDLLKVCRVCPFRAACISLVKPRASLFDGICGGRLWLNGEIRATCETAHPGELAEGARPITHGTPAGARAHRRRGEPVCSLCKEAVRLDQAARREREKASRQQAPHQHP
ncbi:hypothetical protein ACWDBP_34845 [Streptomyces sp. NPDC001233]|uniref:hypothetical protein n=1 Tax=Streptomyces sp. NPDC002589 TaxID=3154420 RepID=UPI003333A7FA